MQFPSSNIVTTLTFHWFFLLCLPQPHFFYLSGCDIFTIFLEAVASTINTLGDALYKVFCASSDPSRNEMRQACQFRLLEFWRYKWTNSSAIRCKPSSVELGCIKHYFPRYKG
ncbi:uncharacterized protein LOC127901328 isoform X2 [Citrus sinensis]|uniref:uncharacterized protein LOC127901328 isoform X2 n=1 Tax=Citrus sinensis TaxID=2711 RepID=UPI0022793A6F|nr:uncharacterized protein LOC127901328 isoform X2 [Citrus sinensis]